MVVGSVQTGVCRVMAKTDWICLDLIVFDWVLTGFVEILPELVRSPRRRSHQIRWYLTRSADISLDSAKILSDLVDFKWIFVEKLWISLDFFDFMIGLGGLGFRGGNRPINLLVLDYENGDPHLTTELSVQAVGDS